MLPIALVALAAATLGILVILVIALSRHLARLVASLVAFQNELTPIVGRIRGDAERAARRLQGMADHLPSPRGR